MPEARARRSLRRKINDSLRLTKVYHKRTGELTTGGSGAQRCGNQRPSRLNQMG